MNRVYPIGTEQDPLGLRLAEIMRKPNTHVIDCRFNPWSSRLFWQKDELVVQFGSRYHAAGGYLGNKKHPSNMMFSGKVEVELVNPAVGIAGLMAYLQEGYDLVLIGHYLEYSDSHLTEVIRLLQEKMPDVQVLLPEEKPVAMPSRGHIKVGAKVLLQKIPAVILRTARTPEGDYLLCWLRVARQNPLDNGKWLAAEIGPIQSYKLVKRHTVIPELDGEEVTRG